MNRIAHRVVAIAGLLAAGLVTAVWADVVTIPATSDNTSFQDVTGSLSNGAGPVMFAGNNGQSLSRRALIRFDIAAHVPSGAVIAGVVLTLNVSNAPDTIPRTFTLHRVLRGWGEGTSTSTGGGGAAATPGDATWVHTFWPDSLWASAGGDVEPVVSGSHSVGDRGVYTWSAPLMAEDVQAWLDAPAGNFGWMLIGDETVPATARRFDSRENEVAANRPALTLTYSLPAAVGSPIALDAVALGPCRPNPGVGRVQFEFVLLLAGRAKLIVTDVAGRLIATVIDRPLGLGGHEATWDGRDRFGRPVPAGTYYYRMALDGRNSATRRLVILR